MTEHIKGAWDNRSTARTYLQILTGSAKQRPPMNKHSKGNAFNP